MDIVDMVDMDMVDMDMVEGSAVVPSNVWSSSSMFFGNIQLNDFGEVSQEEEEDDPGQAAARASSQEDTQWLDWELDL